jgi:hypothetical protein
MLINRNKVDELRTCMSRVERKKERKKTNESEVNILLLGGGPSLPDVGCSVLELALSAHLVNTTFIAVHASALLTKLCSCS